MVVMPLTRWRVLLPLLPFFSLLPFSIGAGESGDREEKEAAWGVSSVGSGTGTDSGLWIGGKPKVGAVGFLGFRRNKDSFSLLHFDAAGGSFSVFRLAMRGGFSPVGSVAKGGGGVWGAARSPTGDATGGTPPLPR